MALEVANAILAQLGGAGRLKAMIGAHCFVGSDQDRDVEIWFKARASNGANRVRVQLHPNDTYNVEFVRVRRGRDGLPVRSIVHTSYLVYAEDLRPIFEAETGLRLSL